MNGGSSSVASAVSGAPKLNAVPDATWGLHGADANLAQGNLVRVLRSQIQAYTGRAGAGLAG